MFRKRWSVPYFPLIGVLIGISAVSHGLAQGAPTETGAEMLELCDPGVKTMAGEVVSGEGNQKALYCSGYVSGFIDGMVVSGPFKGGPSLICLPPSGVDTEQVIRVYVKYLRERPERLHQSGRVLLYASLRNAYPCKP